MRVHLTQVEIHGTYATRIFPSHYLRVVLLRVVVETILLISSSFRLYEMFPSITEFAITLQVKVEAL